jgi:hypothetical protein
MKWHPKQQNLTGLAIISKQENIYVHIITFSHLTHSLGCIAKFLVPDSQRYRRLFTEHWQEMYASRGVFHKVYTQNNNWHFLAFIPSWWKNLPILLRVVGARPSPFNISTITYKAVVYAPSSEGRYTPPFSTLPLYVLCGVFYHWTIETDRKKFHESGNPPNQKVFLYKKTLVTSGRIKGPSAARTRLFKLINTYNGVLHAPAAPIAASLGLLYWRINYIERKPRESGTASYINLPCRADGCVYELEAIQSCQLLVTANQTSLHFFHLEPGRFQYSIEVQTRLA